MPGTFWATKAVAWLLPAPTWPLLKPLEALLQQLENHLRLSLARAPLPTFPFGLTCSSPPITVSVPWLGAGRATPGFVGPSECFPG